MYAIFENGSKQYRASVGDIVKLEKLNAEIGATVSFPVIMVADENGISAGKEVENVKAVGEVVLQDKDRKIVVFKYKAKKNERKKQGHRQPYTKVKITAIEGIGDEAPKKAPAKKSVKKAPKAAPAKEADKETPVETAEEKEA